MGWRSPLQGQPWPPGAWRSQRLGFPSAPCLTPYKHLFTLSLSPRKTSSSRNSLVLLPDTKRASPRGCLLSSLALLTAAHLLPPFIAELPAGGLDTDRPFCGHPGCKVTLCLLALPSLSLSHVSPPGPAQPLPELAVPAHSGPAPAWIPLLQCQLKMRCEQGTRC